MFYQAQANVSHNNLVVKKNQRIKPEVFEKLPDRLKVKFKLIREVSELKPKGFNEIIGDSDKEKTLREQAAKEDAAKTTGVQAAKEDAQKKEEQTSKQPPERKR